MDGCEGCYYNRPMTAWGETFQACFYKVEQQTELYGDNDKCSGYEEQERQLELDLMEI